MKTVTVSQPAVYLWFDVCVTRLYFLYCDYKQLRLKEECFYSSIRMNDAIRATGFSLLSHGKMNFIHVLWLSKLPH